MPLEYTLRDETEKGDRQNAKHPRAHVRPQRTGAAADPSRGAQSFQDVLHEFPAVAVSGRSAGSRQFLPPGPATLTLNTRHDAPQYTQRWQVHDLTVEPKHRPCHLRQTQAARGVAAV